MVKFQDYFNSRFVSSLAKNSKQKKMLLSLGKKKLNILSIFKDHLFFYRNVHPIRNFIMARICLKKITYILPPFYDEPSNEY